MVAAGPAVERGGAAELAHADDERPIQQAAPLEVAHQRAQAGVEGPAQRGDGRKVGDVGVPGSRGESDLPQIDVADLDPDDGQILRLVVTVIRKEGTVEEGGPRRSLRPGAVLVRLRQDFQAAPPTAGGHTQDMFGKRVAKRVADGIRTRDPQIHNLVR